MRCVLKKPEVVSASLVMTREYGLSPRDDPDEAAGRSAGAGGSVLLGAGCEGLCGMHAPSSSATVRSELLKNFVIPMSTRGSEDEGRHPPRDGRCCLQAPWRSSVRAPLSSAAEGVVREPVHVELPAGDRQVYERSRLEHAEAASIEERDLVCPCRLDALLVDERVPQVAAASIDLAGHAI